MTAPKLADIMRRANNPFQTSMDGIAVLDADRDYLLSLIGRVTELADTYEQASERFMREAKQKEEAGFNKAAALRYSKARSSIIFSSKIRGVIE